MGVIDAQVELGQRIRTPTHCDTGKLTLLVTDGMITEALRRLASQRGSSGQGAGLIDRTADGAFGTIEVITSGLDAALEPDIIRRLTSHDIDHAPRLSAPVKDRSRSLEYLNALDVGQIDKGVSASCRRAERKAIDHVGVGVESPQLKGLGAA